MTALQIPGLAAQHSLIHAFSPRMGGHSVGRFAEANMSFRVGDEARIVESNRRSFLSGFGVDLGQVICPKQAHTADIAVVTAADCGRGARSYDDGVEAVDGLITRDSGVCLMVMAADCTPVILFDPTLPAVGLVHAGRVGTQNGIVLRAVEAMRSTFGSDPGSLIVGIGPTISARHYPLTEEKARQVRSSPLAFALDRQSNGEVLFDLTRAHTESLMALGVAADNIHISGLCTFDNEDLLYSERRDGAPTGRFASIAMLG